MLNINNYLNKLRSMDNRLAMLQGNKLSSMDERKHIIFMRKELQRSINNIKAFCNIE